SFLRSGYDLTPWAEAVVSKIQKNWLLPAGQWIGKTNQVGISVWVKRNGQLTLMKVETASQAKALDQAALRAINLSLPLPELPDDFPEDQVELYLVFEYHD
ncbi:MAG: TonB family protein, partial [Candidatus Aminicenantales bacterium]